MKRRQLGFKYHALALFCAAPLLGLAQTTSTSSGQAYPSKPIRFIVPFPAGGAGDLVIRPLAQKMSESWRQPVVLDNRAGASGALGLQMAANAPAAPSVPTVAESGFPGFEVVQWFGAFAPAGTPRAIVVKANGELNRAMSHPDVQEGFARQGFETRPATPEQFAAYVKSELDKWSRVIKEAGIRAE